MIGSRSFKTIVGTFTVWAFLFLFFYHVHQLHKGWSPNALQCYRVCMHFNWPNQIIIHLTRISNLAEILLTPGSGFSHKHKKSNISPAFNGTWAHLWVPSCNPGTWRTQMPNGSKSNHRTGSRSGCKGHFPWTMVFNPVQGSRTHERGRTWMKVHPNAWEESPHTHEKMVPYPKSEL